ncbi:S-adenosyl-L-methionine-dependent methyltransferase [Exidia glandulosa HHB12029]|uniref:S-adenosyl-L-methionine-dependent methyltransferase n=1 Tax=Exidia glandulosa HHB12029 TaxID=1314781 RepID=A0A165PLG4_EXIGL|nr:S-adenosyl-L-methionine-dependent methyltransferase [Exidia glandulosa HHB12029]
MTDSSRPTTIEDWTRSEEYTAAHLISPPQCVLDAASASVAAGLPDMATSAPEAKFLGLLVRTHKAKRVLEIGTLGGYSGIWMALALPEDGELVTLEFSDHHAAVAQKNFENAGLAHKIKIHVGPAIHSLAKLEPSPPFDIVFIDADSENCLPYFLEGKRLISPGGVILVDNIIRYGQTADPAANDPKTEGVRSLLRHIKTDREVEATVTQTIGGRGFDGFLYATRLT